MSPYKTFRSNESASSTFNKNSPYSLRKKNLQQFDKDEQIVDNLPTYQAFTRFRLANGSTTKF